VLQYLQKFYIKSTWKDKDPFWGCTTAKVDSGNWDKQLVKATDKTFVACDNALIAMERFQNDGVSKLDRDLKKKQKRLELTAASAVAAKEAKLAALEQSVAQDQEKATAAQEEAAKAAAEITSFESKIKPFFVVSGSREEAEVLKNLVDVIWVRDGHSISQSNASIFAARLVPDGKYIKFIHVCGVEISY